MGSAVPRPKGLDASRDVLAALERHARQHMKDGGEPRTPELLALYDSLIENHPRRDEIRAFVMAYLIKCMVAGTPDYRRWEPFS